MNQNTTHVYGQMSGNGSYKAPNMYQNKGPRVTGGGDRYDNYGQGGHQYGGKQQGMSGCEKCCACLAGLACCCVICDCLT